MPAIGQQLSQLQELGYTGRSDDIDTRKIDDDLAIASVAHHIGDSLELISHFRLLG
jgi:hypothetical protein